MTSPTLPAHLTTNVLSHAQKVTRLYRACLLDLRDRHTDRFKYRYDAVLLRKQFDDVRNEVDMIKAKKMLEDGYRELLSRKVPLQMRYPEDPGGVAYGRSNIIPDYVLDNWHPLEKAQYPDYFARRDERKQEYIDRWKEKYGPTDERIR